MNAFLCTKLYLIIPAFLLYNQASLLLVRYDVSAAFRVVIPHMAKTPCVGKCSMGGEIRY